MTKAEHAARILRTLRTVERAQAIHHAALAAFAMEYGKESSLDEATMTAAAAPKDEPDND